MPNQAELARGSGGANGRGVDQPETDAADQHLKRPIHGQHAPGDGAVEQQSGLLAGRNRLAAEHGLRPHRKARSGRPIGDREDLRWALGGNRGADERGMDVKQVADEFRGDFVGLQHRAHQPWRPVPEWRHPVEEVGRVPGARLDRREPFLVGSARVTERDAMSPRHEPADQVEPAIELGRQRDDSDVRRRALDLGEDVGSGEIGRPTCPARLTCPPCPQCGPRTA